MAIIEGAVGRIQPFAGVPGAGTDEVQTLTFGGTPTGGTFTLTFEGHTTAAITWTAVDATLVTAIDTALEALPNIGASGVAVADTTLTSGIGDVTITFGGNRTKQPVGAITYTSSLTGTAPTLAVVETTPGVAAAGRGYGKGAMFSDTTNGKLYINSGTALAPTWTVVGSQS